MTIDIDTLERLAKAAGGELWSTDTGTGHFEGAHVWHEDGDAVCRCFSNVGHLPELIDETDVAGYIAAANPAAILELIAELRKLREALNTPLLTAAYAPYVDGIMGLEGINRDVAACAFNAGAPTVTVCYGQKRVYTSMAEFDAAHPKELS